MDARIPGRYQRITRISSDVKSIDSNCDATNSSKESAARLIFPLLILCAGLITYLPWLGSYGLLDPTDSFFLESGREIIETQKYLLPINNYEPWLDKPILFFWLVVASFKAFGLQMFAGRLPAALSAILCSLLIYGGTRPILSRPSAAIAALIFLSCPIVSIIGHVCLTDMTLCALITGTTLYLFKGLREKSKKELCIGYFFAALAFLCKGPIALIICGMALIPFIASISQSPQQFLQYFWSFRPMLGLLIVAIINLPWYVAAEIESGYKFWYAFFYQQNFGRMVGTVNHQGPFWFYIPVFFGGFFPWCLYSITAVGLFKKSLEQKLAETSRYRQLLRLCFFWFATVIVLFSAIKTKLPTYILPCLPPFAILIAMQLQVLARSGKKLVLIIPTALLSLAMPVAVLITPSLKTYIKPLLIEHAWLLAPLALSLAFCWFSLVKKQINKYVTGLILMALLACGTMVPHGLQSFYREKQIGFGKLVSRAKEDNASVAMIFAEEPSVPWTIHKPVSRLQNSRDAEKFLLTKEKPHYVLVQAAILPRLDWFKNSVPRVLLQEGKWYLIDVDQKLSQ